jgi:hypothetical protein
MLLHNETTIAKFFTALPLPIYLIALWGFSIFQMFLFLSKQPLLLRKNEKGREAIEKMSLVLLV